MWGEVELGSTECGESMYHGSSIVIAVYAVEACQTVPESCKDGNAMGNLLHCVVSFLQATPMPCRALVCAVPPPPQAETVDGMLRLAEVLHTAPGRSSYRAWRYLVDPASSHMLVSKIKPCMSKYECLCTVKLRMAH